MALAIVGILGFLITLWLVLSVAQRLRPETFRFQAKLTKWMCLELEMRSGRSPVTIQGDQAIDGGPHVLHMRQEPEVSDDH